MNTTDNNIQSAFQTEEAGSCITVKGIRTYLVGEPKPDGTETIICRRIRDYTVTVQTGGPHPYASYVDWRHEELNPEEVGWIYRATNNHGVGCDDGVVAFAEIVVERAAFEEFLQKFEREEAESDLPLTQQKKNALHDAVCDVANFPRNGTYCQHSYDCCGQMYYSTPQICEYDYGYEAPYRKFVVTMSGSRNV